MRIKICAVTSSSLMHRLLNRLNHFKRFKFKTCLVSAIAIASFFGALSCGKRKPPLPPVDRVKQIAAINGIQIGNEIRVIWQMPARNAPDGSILNISRVDVYRLAEPLDASLSLTEEEFASRSTLIGSVPVSDSDFALKQLSYTDVLQFAGQPVRLRYAVRLVNASGQKAAFSNFLLMEPTARVANAPGKPSAEVSQEAVTVSWEAPSSNVDGSEPANVLGYNIYRSLPDTAVGRLNEKGPLDSTEFRDEFFEFDRDYTYFVRTVSLGVNAEQIESLDSVRVSVKTIDTFPPAPPSALTIAASPNTISIFFAANIESDVSGYRVYRSTNPDAPLDEWQLLTPDLLDVTTYQDQEISVGTRYYYYVKAVDLRGNISEPSKVVSEAAF